MKTGRLLTAAAALLILLSPVASKDFMVEDSSSNEPGEKNIWNVMGDEFV